MERVRTPGDESVSLCAFSLADADGCSGVAASSHGGVGGGAGTGVGTGASRVSSVPSIVCCWSYFLHFALLHAHRMLMASALDLLRLWLIQACLGIPLLQGAFMSSRSAGTLRSSAYLYYVYPAMPWSEALVTRATSENGPVEEMQPSVFLAVVQGLSQGCLLLAREHVPLRQCLNHNNNLFRMSSEAGCKLGILV